MPTQVVKEARTTVTTTDDIIDLDNNTKIEGKCLIKSYTVSEGRAGLYVTGILCLKGNIDFKVWNADAKNSLGNSMIVTDWQGKVVQFNGYVNVYNDRKSIILTDVTELPAENPMEYMPTPYDRPTEWQLYRDFAKENLSKKAYAVFQTILKGYDLYQLATECGYTLEKLPNNKLFSMEAAAIAHHDACPVGLIAHSRKVAENTVNLVKHYPTIIRTVDYDALVLGALLHDFGKAAEYYVGAISKVGAKVSHLTLTCELLATYRPVIVKEMSLDAYYTLLSIFSQHHGVYGDRPRTIEAYIIHWADLVESRLQPLEEALVQGNVKGISAALTNGEYAKLSAQRIVPVGLEDYIDESSAILDVDNA